MNILESKKAYYNYIEKDYDTGKALLSYIKERIEANAEEIKELTSITKEKVNLKSISKLFEKPSKYKSSTKVTINTDGFLRGTLTTGKGVILKKETDITKVVECYIDALLSRNAVVVEDENYLGISVKEFILEIIQEAMRKFDVDPNLIRLLPPSEVNEKEFSTYEQNNNCYIYLENDVYKNEVKGKKVLTGKIDDVIDAINSDGVCNCAIIYTQDRKKAYKFLNRVTGKNVFVNAGEENAIDVEVDDLYINKNIIYPNE